MIEVPVYIPARAGEGREVRMGSHLAAIVAEGSAIVGARESDGMVVVYYEGNLHGACNMVTLADRAMFAYGRARDRYPTVAMMAVPASQLARVGTLYPEHGRIEVHNGRELYEIARWLGIDLAQGREATDRLHSELRCDGVRV